MISVPVLYDRYVVLKDILKKMWTFKAAYKLDISFTLYLFCQKFL